MLLEIRLPFRRLLAILQKGEGRTFEDIANEHGVSSRSVQRGLLPISKVGLMEER
jgi:hypothetical protein